MATKEPNDIDSYVLQVILTILHIIGNLKHTGIETTSEIELSYPQSLILYTILEKESATITELSRSLKMAMGEVSRMVYRLEEKGLVERSRNPQDRRVVTVRLSQEGREHVIRLIDYHLDGLRQQLLDISERDRETFLRVLKSIDGKLDNTSAEEADYKEETELKS